MLLGLSKIIDCPGASLPFSVSMDLSDLCYGVSYPVTEPVLASGTVRNTAGVLMMTGEITTCIHGTCDRCARDFDRDIRFPLEVVLVWAGCWPWVTFASVPGPLLGSRRYYINICWMNKCTTIF